MLRSFTNGFVTIGLMTGLLTICGSQEALGMTAQPSAPLASTADEQILGKYDHFDPTQLINTKLLKAATLYFDKNKSKFANQRALTVIDYSLHSSKKRFFLINTSTGEVWATYTAHGKGSDANHDGYADRFSNTSGSNATSLGPYVTDYTYQGEHGYSLNLKGLSSTNSNAYSRRIVIHGADYVVDEARRQGRSQGCPALAMKYSKKVINFVKDGSLLYAGASAQL